MQLSYTTPQDPQLDLQIESFLKFWGKRADELVLVRVLANPIGRGDADVACGRNGADLLRLVKSAARERYIAADGSPRIYQGTYARLCHACRPRDWLDRERPTLTAATAVQLPGFMVDIDAIKAGDSSNERELQETLRTADEILGWMDSVIGPDRSYCLPVMSGTGTQLEIRANLDLDQAGLARTLLLRMRVRWPTVDDSGWMPSIGPALPGTLKCKGQATEDRPHRMVQILSSPDGDRRLSVDDLKRLIAALPEVPNEALVNRRWGRAYDAFSAVAELPIEELCEKYFGHRSICPVCRSTDASVAVIGNNLVTCQHRLRCPAARTGKTGFNGVHVYGVLRGYGWGPYAPEQRADIVTAAQTDGWELSWDDGEDREWPEERVAALAPRVAAILTPEPSRHCSVGIDTQPWRLRVKGPREAADRCYRALVAAYCPDFADERPLTMTGRLHIYHQGLGIFVPVTSSRDTRDLARISRILGDQERVGGGIWVPGAKGMTVWSPPAQATLEALELQCSRPEFFANARVGLACRDGFLELQNGRWRVLPHSPSNRARGRVSRTSGEVLREIESGKANAAQLALRKILVRTLRRDDDFVDDVLRVFLEQVGAVLSGVAPELRSGLFFHGAEDTGKSSLLRIAAAMLRRLGLKVASASIADLNHNFPPETLLDAGANIKEDEGAFDSGRPVKAERLKQVVEGSHWTFARKNQSSLDICIQPLWMAASNAEISFAEVSGAISKRCYIIQYPSTPTPTDQLDLKMVPRFLAEHLDGIIAASLIGAAQLQRNGRTSLNKDSEIVRHTRELGRSLGLVEAWLQSGASLSQNHATDTLFDHAHAACIAWGQKHGMRAEADVLRIDKFTREINKLSARKVRWSHGVKYAPVVLVSVPSSDHDDAETVSRL